MNINNEADFNIEDFLAQSPEPKLDANCKKRIVNISKALAAKNSNKVSGLGFLGEISRFFNLPRRSILASAMILVLGFGLGFYEDQLLGLNPNYSQEIEQSGDEVELSEFFYDEGEII